MHKVMVVDDEAIITTQLEERLAFMGYDVVGVASSGEEAVEEARRTCPDVILMDIVMPGAIDGIEASKKISAELDIPILFLTAYSDDDLVQKAKDVKPFAYIVKPYQEREIQAAIEIAIHKKSIERKLQQQHAFLETILASVTGPFYVVDTRDYTVKMANLAADVKALGEDTTCHAHNCGLQTPCPDRNSCPVDVVKASGAHRVFERCCRQAEGETHNVEVHGYPVFDEAGNVTRVILHEVDVGERKRAEQERRSLDARVQQAQKLDSLSVLASGVAHDFNNWLVGIVANADIALHDLPFDSSVREDIVEIAKAGRQCAALANQMLAYSGKGKFVAEPTDLPGLIEQMRNLLESSVARGCSVELNFPEDLAAIDTDPSQIRQVVLNLVINASEAIGDRPGKVMVTGRMEHCDRHCRCRLGFPGAENWPEGLRLAFEVSDTGDGMDEETRAKIFDPFFTTKSTGRGLGMSAVHGILRGHEAGIKVESEPGKGTTFTVHFPVVDHPADFKASRKKSPGDWHGSGTILIVDDEEIVLRVGTKVLQRLGFTVVTAVDGVDAIEVFKKHESEIVGVLLDLTMPRMSGEQTFAELQRLRSDVPVILSSGFSEAEASAHFVGKGPAGFVQKPYDIKTLRATFSGILQD